MYVEIALISTKGADVGKNENQIDPFEAMTHPTRLLDRVAAGDRITITRHGTPIARLVPVRAGGTRQLRDTIAKLKEFSKGHTLAGLNVKDMVSEGRR